MTEEPFEQPSTSQPFDPVNPDPPVMPTRLKIPVTARPAGSMPPPPVARQLVRDPYSKLGGVASGLGHHFGIDVSLVRLGFVLFTLFTGLGLLIYPLAWLVIPRAQYWPPVAGPAMGRAVSKREVGLGLVVVGVLVALYLGGGAASQVFVPLLLMGGGVWLLLQPSAELDRTPAPTDGFSASTTGAIFQPDIYQDSVRSIPPPPSSGTPPGTPVGSGKSGGGKVVIGLLALGGLAVAALVGGMVLVAGSSMAPASKVYLVESVEEIPEVIELDVGDVLVDLSAIDPAGFETPATLKIGVDIGDVQVIVPEGLVVDVEADADVGDIEVFGQSESGIDIDVRVADPDAMLFLDVDMDVGSIKITEG